MATVRRQRALAGLGVTGLALTLALTGCGADSSDNAAGSSGEAPAVAPAMPNQKDAAGGGAAPEAASGAGGGAPVINREVIYTGALTVRVGDVDARAEEAIGLAEAAGGFVGSDARSSDVARDDVPYERATLTLRIPRDAFAATLDRVAGLGTEESRKIDAQDVTEEVIDLDSRIASQRAQVDSARRLLEQAKSLSDLISLENELARREADLASLEAKRDRLKDLASLSTLTVELVQDSAPAARDTDSGGFLVGLRNGWDAFLTFGVVLLTVLGALLPWAVAIGLPLTATILLWRRLRRRRATTPATAASVPAAPAS